MVTSALAVVLMVIVLFGLMVGLFLLSSLSYPHGRSVPRHMKESRLGHSAHHLVSEVDEAVRHCSIPKAKQKILKQQAREISDNITSALWKLYHLRKIRQLATGVGGTSYTAHVISESTEMERKLLYEIDRSLEVLFSVPLSLMKVGLAQAERTADRLLAELRETNERMRDIASSYDDMKASDREPFMAGAPSAGTSATGAYAAGAADGAKKGAGASARARV
jgi:hypothetical protein